ncbi:phage tail assembly protein [Niallia circulans]|uniref:Phage tail assembly protein n=1 Tax=Niallia circulans TaxID=1397 RepID=A0A553SNF4_NIACI|nr:phage tail assembly protein [Niallia circulans]TRZ38529.1 phage tail assembly protein [Niallia circulans]
MTQLEKTTNNTASTTTESNEKGIVKFNKPFSFDGETFTQVDVSGVENLTGQDLDDAENMLLRVNKPSMVPEMSMTYLFFLASKATGKPQEFFFQLPAKDSLKVKRTVTSFLNAAE